MVAGPGDALEAGGHAHLRASDADREQAIGILKGAFVDGRLTKDELVARAALTFAAQTYAELTVLTADLPAGLADAAAHGRAVQPRARRPMSMAAKAGIAAEVALRPPAATAWASACPGRPGVLTPAIGRSG